MTLMMNNICQKCYNINNDFKQDIFSLKPKSIPYDNIYGRICVKCGAFIPPEKELDAITMNRLRLKKYQEILRSKLKDYFRS